MIYIYVCVRVLAACMEFIWLCHQISPACSLRQMRCLGSNAPGETGGSCPVTWFPSDFCTAKSEVSKVSQVGLFKKK